MADSPPIKPVSVSEIKSKLLRPALTSHFICDFQPPDTGFINSRVDAKSSPKRFDRLTLACSDASLPGSSIATHEINNDYTGVTERHAYRRLYDDRTDFTFYVDADEYYVIRFFESWIGYTINEQYGSDETKNSIKGRTYNYRVSYPDSYCTDTLSITKFERHVGIKKGANNSALKYVFVKAFPISIQSMPVSYDASQLLKCTVSFTYSRYYIENLTLNNPTSQSNPNAPAISELNNILSGTLSDTTTKLGAATDYVLNNQSGYQSSNPQNAGIFSY